MNISKSYVFPLAKVNVYVPLNYEKANSYPVLLVNDGDFFAFGGMDLGCVVVALTPSNRSGSFSPFPVTGDQRMKDFIGGGTLYNDWLIRELLPILEKDFSLDKGNLNYGGVSLGGLEAIYSLYFHDCFSSIFSICGSFWFPGFVKFVRGNKTVSRPKVVILNGSKEGTSNKNSIFSNAVHSAKEVANLLNAEFFLDDYGHHGHIEKRFDFVLKKIGLAK